MVLGFFDTIRGFFALKRKPNIDNWVFRMNYKISAGLILLCCCIVTANQYIGDPIDCFGPTPGLAGFNKIVDNYCWIHSTFTVTQALNKKVGVEVPHPGIDRHTPGEERVYHRYYQWVCFILAFQTLAFYLPHFLWKSLEGGKISALTGSDFKNPVLDTETKEAKIRTISNYFKNHCKSHQWYYFKYVACEVLNLVNIVVQIIGTDKFLGGEFSNYGLSVLSFMNMNDEDRVDPMVKVFPKMTKCTFHFYGTSGDVQKNDLMCILSVNIVNEKIYMALWFWFIFMVIVNSLQVIHRGLLFFSPCLQNVAFKSQFLKCGKQLRIAGLLDHFRIGDWFLLHQLQTNMEKTYYDDLILELSDEGSYSEKKALVSEA